MGVICKKIWRTVGYYVVEINSSIGTNTSYIPANNPQTGGTPGQENSHDQSLISVIVIYLNPETFTYPELARD